MSDHNDREPLEPPIPVASRCKVTLTSRQRSRKKADAAKVAKQALKPPLRETFRDRFDPTLVSIREIPRHVILSTYKESHQIIGRPSKAAPQLEPTTPQLEDAGVFKGNGTIANLPAQAAPVVARVFKGTMSANLLAQAAPHPAEAAQQHCRHNDSDTDTGTNAATNIYIGKSGDAQSSRTVSERTPIYEPDAIHSNFSPYSITRLLRQSRETQMPRAGHQKTTTVGVIPHRLPIQKGANTLD